MNIKINIKPKVAYFISIFTALTIFLFFSYKAVIAFLIYRELYGVGLDTLVLLRASVAGIMFLLIILFIQFMKINDLKSQRTILRGIFVGWTSVFIALLVLKISSIYFIILTGISSLIILVVLFSLICTYVHMLYRNKGKENHIFIHLNLCIALALALVVFLAGIGNATDDRVSYENTGTSSISHGTKFLKEVAIMIE